MGKAGDHDYNEVLRPPIRDDDFQWEYEREVIAHWDAAKLAEVVAFSTIRKPQRGHAYSRGELQSLRKILSLDEDTWPYERMHLHTDALAVLVGFHIRSERNIAPKDRIPEIHHRLGDPANKLLNALRSEDFSREFLVAWSGLKEVNTDLLVTELEKLVVGVSRHTDIIKRAGGKGKKWDSDLKDHFLRNVAFFCEFAAPSFELSPKSLKRPAYILAKPLFERDHLDKDVSLDNALRKFVIL